MYGAVVLMMCSELEKVGNTPFVGILLQMLQGLPSRRVSSYVAAINLREVELIL